MRLSVLGLIGFTAFILCPTTCPMNGDVVSENSHEMHQGMHVNNGGMHHDADKEPCEHCGVNASVELALIQGTSLGMHMPFLPVTLTVLNAHTAVQPLHLEVPKTHLAHAGPPVVPDIIRTVVLRT